MSRREATKVVATLMELFYEEVIQGNEVVLPKLGKMSLEGEKVKFETSRTLKDRISINVSGNDLEALLKNLK